MNKLKMPIGYIRIYEDWNQDNDGCIWYRWRAEGEKYWHTKLTPYKEKPVISYKYISPQELGKLTSGSDLRLDDPEATTTATNTSPSKPHHHKEG